MSDAMRERAKELMKRAGLGDVSPVVVGAALFVALIMIGLALVRWWPATTASTAASEAAGPTVVSRDAGPAAETSSSAEASRPAEVYVHVAGAVRHPGVYRLPAGSRAIDAIEEAGGTLGSAATDALNLARTVSDGEQLLVPKEGEEVAPAGQTTAATPQPQSVESAPSGGPVNINSADAQALDSLPGVGPSTAAKIIQDREANGPFASPDDLGRVSGIGPKKLNALAGLITVQ
jgi:competence protein ComEA